MDEWDPVSSYLAKHSPTRSNNIHHAKKNKNASVPMRREASPMIHPLNCLLDSLYAGNDEKKVAKIKEMNGQNLPTKNPQNMEDTNFSMK